MSPTLTAHTQSPDPTSSAASGHPRNQPNSRVPAHPRTQAYPPRPATTSRARRAPDVIAPASSPARTGGGSELATDRRAAAAHGDADQRALRSNFLTTPRAAATPPRRAPRRTPRLHTKRAASPAARTPSEHMAPGAAGNRPAPGRPHPSAPRPASARALQLTRGPAIRWGGGPGRRKTHVSVPGQEKVWFPPPSPAARRRPTLRGAGPAEPARSALCSELGPEGEGRGGGWAPTSAPPPPSDLRPDSMLAAPCPGDRAFPPPEARLSLGRPEGPGAHKLFWGSLAPRAPLP